jgi:hypothetical protein
LTVEYHPVTPNDFFWNTAGIVFFYGTGDRVFTRSIGPGNDQFITFDPPGHFLVGPGIQPGKIDTALGDPVDISAAAFPRTGNVRDTLIGLYWGCKKYACKHQDNTHL